MMMMNISLVSSLIYYLKNFFNSYFSNCSESFALVIRHITDNGSNRINDVIRIVGMNTIMNLLRVKTDSVVFPTLISIQNIVDAKTQMKKSVWYVYFWWFLYIALTYQMSSMGCHGSWSFSEIFETFAINCDRVCFSHAIQKKIKVYFKNFQRNNV